MVVVLPDPNNRSWNILSKKPDGTGQFEVRAHCFHALEMVMGLDGDSSFYVPFTPQNTTLYQTLFTVVGSGQVQNENIIIPSLK